MRRTTLSLRDVVVAGISICVIAAGVVLWHGSVQGQSEPPGGSSSSAGSCVYPLNCENNPAHPCCVASGCNDILIEPGVCGHPPSLPSGKGGIEGASAAGGDSVLTTTHYRNYRANTCVTTWQSAAGNLAYNLPIGAYYVQSPTNSGYLQHVYCDFADIPEGATLTRFCLYGYDNTSPSGHIAGSLYRGLEYANSTTTLGSASSASGSSSWCSSTFSEAVNYTSYNYFASVYMSSGYSTDLKLYTVEVWYTTP